MIQASNPKARGDLELVPMEHEGQQLILIRDPLGLVAEGTAILPPMLQFMALLDGSRGLAKLAEELGQAMGGGPAPVAQLQGLVDELSQTGLLEDERYLAAAGAMRAEFAAAPTRTAANAGQSYPEDAEELAEFLQGILDAAEAPEPGPGPIRALVSPHIDPPVGREVYGAAYRALAESKQRPKRVVVLGIGHSMDEGLFCPCQKDFTTPLGVAANDAATSAALAKAAGDALSLDDFVHRDEHSIEFQLIFLQRILGAESFSLVPVLCGNLMHGLPEYTRAAYQEAAGGFLAGLRELAADPQTLLVAGVDLCHVGPKFGHQAQASELLHEAGAHDRALLAAVAKGDADALWAESARVRDRYHVCGFSALAALLEVLGPGQNQILSYQMMQEEPTQSAVGFGAGVLY